MFQESQWMRQMEEKIGEQLQMFNSQMQAERDVWQNQLKNCELSSLQCACRP